MMVRSRTSSLVFGIATLVLFGSIAVSLAYPSGDGLRRKVI